MNSISITIPNPTTAQVNALASILADIDVGRTSDMSDLVAGARKGGKRKKSAPLKTVSPDEDEDFADEELDEDEVEALAEEEENEKSKRKAKKKAVVEEDDEEEDEDEEEEEIDFENLKALINKYGHKSESGMRSILTGVNIKSTAELKKNPKKWEPVYRKVKAKLAASKKRS